MARFFYLDVDRDASTTTLLVFLHCWFSSVDGVDWLWSDKDGNPLIDDRPSLDQNTSITIITVRRRVFFLTNFEMFGYLMKHSFECLI